MTTRDEVDAVNDECARALADQDVARMVGLYSDDARLFFSDTPVIQGREAVAAAYTESAPNRWLDDLGVRSWAAAPRRRRRSILMAC
jgi:ketosteroid isomerase-like protein